MKALWSSGDCAALVWADAAALVSSRLGDEPAMNLWAGRASESLPQFLEALGEELKVGLLSLPDFAVVFTGANFAHIACRGSFTVVITHDEGRDELSGAEVTTWAERRTALASVRCVELKAAHALSGSLLPLTGGIVRAAALTIGDPASTGAHEARVVERGRDEPGHDPAVAPGLQPAAGAEPSRVTLVGDSTVAPRLDEQAAEPDGSPVVPVTETGGAENAPAATEVPPEPERGHAPGERQVGQVEEVEEDPEEPPGGRFSALLADHTHMYDIEQAAVRSDDGSESAAWHEESGHTSLAFIPESTPVADPPPGLAGNDAEGISDSAEPETGSFIGAIPDFAKPTPTAEASAVEPEPAADIGPGAETDDLDLSFHDDLTVMETPDGSLDEQPVPADQTRGSGPFVRGLMCHEGHGNPPQRTECRVCGSRLDGDVVDMERPPLGWLHTSGGESLALTTNILAGRAPRASKFQGMDMPQFLPLPHGHVSSTHVEIKIEGWSVLAHDLHSMNGTFLQREGQPTMRLSETPHLLASKDVLNLGHGVTLRFEELP